MNELLNECYKIVDDVCYREDNLNKVIGRNSKSIGNDKDFYSKLVRYIALDINYVIKNVLYYQYVESKRVLIKGYVQRLFDTVISILKNNGDVTIDVDTFNNLFNPEKVMIFRKQKELMQVMVDNETLDKSRFNMIYIYNRLFQFNNINALIPLLKSDSQLKYNPYFTYYLSKCDINLVIKVLYWYYHYQNEDSNLNYKLLDVIALQEMCPEKQEHFYETYLYNILKSKSFTECFSETVIYLILYRNITYTYIPFEASQPFDLEDYIVASDNEKIKEAYYDMKKSRLSKRVRLEKN